jgi:ABC-type nitrate/sulfonate/bicarbonate transport system substrate-binding protein
MQPTPLEAALHSFAVWLSSKDVVHPTQLSHLLDRRLGSKVHHAALRKLAQTYAQICEEVRKPENRYEAANTILGSQRPFGQISVLRQIIGVEGEDR